MNYVLEIPRTHVIDQQSGVKRNKFVENLKGAVNAHVVSKQMTVLDAISSFLDVFKKISSANGQLILEEKEYNTLFSIVKESRSWGDIDGQFELLDAFQRAVKN